MLTFLATEYTENTEKCKNSFYFLTNKPSSETGPVPRRDDLYGVKYVLLCAVNSFLKILLILSKKTSIASACYFTR